MYGKTVLRRSAKSINVRQKYLPVMKGNLKTQIGQPESGESLFTATAAHKMVKRAIKEAQRSGSRIERIHSSSASALEGVLAECVAAN